MGLCLYINMYMVILQPRAAFADMAMKLAVQARDVTPIESLQRQLLYNAAQFSSPSTVGTRQEFTSKVTHLVVCPPIP